MNEYEMRQRYDIMNHYHRCIRFHYACDEKESQRLTVFNCYEFMI